MGALQNRSRSQGTCKVCGKAAVYLTSLNNSHGLPRILEILHCQCCGLVFVGNPVSDEQLAHAYGTLSPGRSYQEIARTTQAKVSRAIDDLTSLLNGRSDISVLDVGCGGGHFLESIARSHLRVRAAGLELPGENAFACQKKGLRVFTCALEQLTEHFHVAVLLDVAEHVLWPNRTFTACASLLREEGYLYIHTPMRCFWDSVFLALARVPGLRRVSRVWLGTRVSIFHLQLWTEQALKLCLERAGFRILYLSRELELSLPLARYSEMYLGSKLHVPALGVRVATTIADLLFVRLGTLRNKAICLAQKRRAP